VVANEPKKVEKERLCKVNKLNNVHIKYNHILRNSGARGTPPPPPVPLREEQSYPVMAAETPPPHFGICTRTFGSTVVLFAQAGYFFYYFLVLGTTRSKSLFLKVKNDLSAA
jgi:hypothetical protein